MKTKGEHKRNLVSNHKNGEDAEDTRFTEAGWDFTLPQIPPPSMPLSPSNNWESGFNLRNLIGAIQGGETIENVRDYLAHYMHGAEDPADTLDGEVDGCPSVFFVVHTGNADMVRIWASYGADLNATYCTVPLLGFAMVHCHSFRTDMPMVIRTLLSFGAAVKVIPRAFYVPLHCDLPEDGPPEELEDLLKRSNGWCIPFVRKRISKALNSNFGIRYLLHVASQTESLSGANKQLARVHRASELLGIRYFLIGQALAAGLLIEQFLTYLAMPTNQPLVLLFAGPSGHGKTELAQNLGRLLSLDLHSVNCTHLRHETDLFGPWSPYQGWEKGSATNNFLASHNNESCIVFMDEFEKTHEEVRQALLLPFQCGGYYDRRHLIDVNASRTIWILATNAFDKTIQEFCSNHRAALFQDDGSKQTGEMVRRLGRRLAKMIQKESIGKFGAPLTGRITDFIPFLTFSPIEQAAVAAKCLSELGRELAKPVNSLEISPLFRPVGNTDLEVNGGYSVCKTLADQGYIQELGARSIINTVDREVRRPLVRQYLAVREEIREVQPAGRFVVGVDAGWGEVQVSQFAVEKD